MVPESGLSVVLFQGPPRQSCEISPSNLADKEYSSDRYFPIKNSRPYRLSPRPTPLFRSEFYAEFEYAKGFCSCLFFTPIKSLECQITLKKLRGLRHLERHETLQMAKNPNSKFF